MNKTQLLEIFALFILTMVVFFRMGMEYGHLNSWQMGFDACKEICDRWHMPEDQEDIKIAAKIFES